MSHIINLTSSPTSSQIDLTANNNAPGPSRRGRSRSRSPRQRSRSRSTNSTFTNIITMERTPRSRGILLNTKLYDVNSMAQMLISNLRARRVSRVPHSRTELTPEQLAEIRRRTSVHGMAAGIPWREGAPAPRVNTLYLRRHLAGGGYKFYMVQHRDNILNVYIARVAGRWEHYPIHTTLERWSDNVLTNTPSVVDYSLDFNWPDQGHWVQVRWQGRQPMDRFSRSQIRLFMSALAYQLPPDHRGIVHPSFHRRR